MAAPNQSVLSDIDQHKRKLVRRQNGAQSLGRGKGLVQAPGKRLQDIFPCSCCGLALWTDIRELQRPPFTKESLALWEPFGQILTGGGSRRHEDVMGRGRRWEDQSAWFDQFQALSQWQMGWSFLDYNRKSYYDPKSDNKVRLGDWYTQKGASDS